MTTSFIARRSPLALLACAGLAAAALAPVAKAQVVLNEVYSNPPGSGPAADDRWEYIEVYGPAGMSLNGYMIASVFGGGDPNGNDIPGPLPAGWDAGDEVPEIDEAWTLDGLTIGSNGLLVIYNANGTAAGRPSFIPSYFDPGTTSGTFVSSHVPTVDVAGRIKNDGSATFVLLRKRPFHTLNASGASLYDGVLGSTITSGPSTFPSSIRYAWRKDTNQDVNFNGRIDLNGLAPYANQPGNRPPESPINSERAATAPVPGPANLEPYQMVDDIAWSNGGGKEYVRSSQQEITDTSGFNPDAISRVNYFNTNPQRGGILINGTVQPTRMADEEFIYGDTLELATLLDYSAQFISGPTSQTSPNRYNATGQLDANGTFKLDRINMVGFKLTPGAFNDVDSSTAGGSNIAQFRFVRGDFNFDGAVNCADYALIQSRLGASLDDTAIILDDNNTLATADDVAYLGWKWQGRAFNSLLAMVRMSTTDGTNGQWNSGLTVTSADVNATLALLPRCGLSDIAGPGPTSCPDGELTADDVILYISLFTQSSPQADIAGPGPTPGADGEFTADDIILFVNRFTGGCN